MLSRIITFVGASCLLCAVAGAADWETDFTKAKTQATFEQKFILMDFTGSDWCPWCMKLDKEVFSQPEFKKYAAKNLVCVTIDSPRAKQLSAAVVKQNTELKSKFDIKGFPTIVLLAPHGTEVARTGYQPGGAAKYVEGLQKLLAPHKDKLKSVPAAKKTSGKAAVQPAPVSANDVHDAVNNAL